ncbi:ABC transporter permease [Glaciecola petra]|uniref:FtsX-like permease family protein n=1 Tax=Glaciecola petra TaxID=3075602 RepID=A0ABU2ZY51_9ALTE|nr:FtsX-like permease family protein [Aestuariibacter sp. P117]MDT0596509.1 FtsX-like permease family protein [Aestuariibacter sp. P117]
MLEIKPIFNALRRSKVSTFLLLIEIAITLAIVSVSAFVIVDRINYLQQETGYPEESLLHFSVLTFGDVDRMQQIELDEEMLRNIPGVENAVFMQDVPLSGSGSASSFDSHPDPDMENNKGIRAAYTAGDENMIDTLGVNLIAGRDFRADEVKFGLSSENRPTVVVASKAFVDEMFPEGDGLGKTVYFGRSPIKIIGIVEQMKGPWLQDSRSDNVVIFPYVETRSFDHYVVRTKPEERTAIKRQIEELMLANYDKRVINPARGFDEAKAEYNAGDILMTRMLMVIIVVLVLITIVGIFGLTLFNINKRTKQIGTRRALGARKSDIIKYFLVENAMVCIAGLGAGALGAVYLGTLLLEEYSLPALDNSFILYTALFVLAISLLSVLIPANRAANISPSIATRSI